jgi:hypothetical protein
LLENRKLIRGTANFFGCIGLGVAILGIVLNNSVVIFASTVEMLICLTVRNHFNEKKGDD